MGSYPRDVAVCKLEAKEAFEGLNAKEKLYAHYIARASWEGAKICLFQTSHEAVPIFAMLQLLVGHTESWDALKAASGVDEGAWSDFLSYASAFYGNFGNFKSFGDSKIVPALSPEAFHAILQASEAAKKQPELVRELWEEARELMYCTDPVKELGFPPSATSGYYSSNVSKADAETAQAFLDARGISGYNTRVFKEEDGSLVVRQAAAEPRAEPVAEGSHNGTHVKVVAGDYGPLMARVVAALEGAKTSAANPHQEAMVGHYVECFKHGSIKAHEEGSREWIKDRGPAVESYIGFIESYRDPLGVKGEWEGFVAVVNRAMSEKFNALVEAAEALLPLLPWPPAFEKDRFLRPDFTSLDVLGFASSGVPSGINIPNYDHIRQEDGFKNVSLGNVIAAAMAGRTITFLSEDDEALYKALVKESFEVQVGLHELLGHGSGKLFCADANGKLNFDPATVDPTTDQPVSSHYKPGETWDSKFQSLASSYEECRAESVGIYLCVNQKVLSIFGHEGQKAQDIIYVNWLNMCRAGLMALEFFRPETGTWGQAHMQARFAILRVLLEAGQGLVTITPHHEKGLLVSLDRSKITTVGVHAIEAFLRKLQVFKATADLARAKAMFVEGYTKVPEEFLKLRATVLEKKKERPLFVQPELVREGPEGEVKLLDFPPTPEGLLASFKARYPAHDEELLALWRADKARTLPPYLNGREGGQAKRTKA